MHATPFQAAINAFTPIGSSDGRRTAIAAPFIQAATRQTKVVLAVAAQATQAVRGDARRGPAAFASVRVGAWLGAGLLALGLCSGAAAQNAAPATKPAAKPSAKPSTKPAAKPAPAPKGLPALSAEQIEASKTVHLGRIACELNASVNVALDPKNPGYVDITFGKQAFKGVTVVSRTGALRVEDNAKGALWLQVGNKSMLMDVKRGQRLADDCVHEEHHKAIAAAKGKPAESLLDAPKAAASAASGAGAVPAAAPAQTAASAAAAK